MIEVVREVVRSQQLQYSLNGENEISKLRMRMRKENHKKNLKLKML